MKKTILISSILALSLQSKTIKDIQFDGLVHISPDIAKEIIDIKKGENLDELKVDKSIKKLYAQKYFSDIWVDENDGVLVYHVKEKPVVSKVNLTGFEKDKADQTLKQANIKKGDIYDENKAKNIKESITKKLESQGYFDSTVEVKNKELNPGSVQTDVIVNKGEQVYIKKVNLFGAKHFTYDEIKENLANREKQFAGWFFGRDDGKLKADQLKFDAGRIKEFYLKHGYMDARVYPPSLKTDFSDYSAELTYKIEEGEAYSVASVNVQIDPAIANAKELKDEFKLKSKKVFDVSKLRYDMSKIQKAVSDKGYAFANIIPDVKPNKQTHTVDINYVVKPNEKVYVNNITISGNTRTQDSVIRRELYLSEGEKFTQTDLSDSLNALKRTGYFNNVQIMPKQVSQDKMDLVVKVDEASTGSIMGGISYSDSYDGLGVNAGISDRNFLGTGIELGTTIDYSEKRLKGSINFKNPRLFDSLYSLSGNIYRNDYDYINYKEKSVGGSLGLGRKIGRNLHLSMTYLYEDTELTDVNGTLKDNVFYQEGRFVKSSFIPSITYDNTDDYYLPRHGVHASYSLEYAGIGGDSKFIKNNLNLKYYYGLEDKIDYDLILRAKLRVSTINDKGFLPLNEKLYMGGYGTVRGYKYSYLSPKDTNGNLQGAKKMAAASFEASIPLVKSMNLRAVGFYDIGKTGEDSFTDIERSSVGAGIEWPKSPLGVPISLFWTKPLDDEDGDRLNKIEFNLGRKF
jgi:outer membrane protein insertion porin family